MKVLLLIALAVFVLAVRAFAPEASGASATAIGAGVLLLAGFFAGSLFKAVGLPKLTGYLAAGILFGPQVLAVISPAMLADLSVFKGIAVALLALTAGLEMDVPTIRPLFRSVRWILLIAVLGTTALLALGVYLLAPTLDFMAGLEPAQLVAVAIALGIAISAQSPAVVVAVRDETAADGPLVKTILAVVVFADLIVIILFAVATTLAKTTFGESADPLQTALTLGWHVGGSILAGAVLGIVLGFFVRQVESGRALFVAALAFVIAEVGERLHLDPLVIALTAGIVIRNFPWARITHWASAVARALRPASHAAAPAAAPATDPALPASAEPPHEPALANHVHHAVEAAGFPVYIAFFAIAGAGVHLDSLVVAILPASILVTVRGLGFWLGTRYAAHLADAPPVVGRLGGFGLMPQAGLALALAALFVQSFPTLGAGTGDLVFSIVAMNEMVAPVLFRLAILKSGEAGRLSAPPDHDHPAPTPLVSVDSPSES
jgi:Kef-type K+ transport system membrane component KefB